MAKLYFYYGVMGSSKTAQALMCNYNYESKGLHPLLTKADYDTRDGLKTIKARIGLEKACITVSDLINVFENADIGGRAEFEESSGYPYPDVIIIDEAQFMSPREVDFMSDLVDDLDIPVICYGLKTDFKGELFPGSERLLEIADKIIEVKTTCWCGRKAIFNARYHGDQIIRDGEQLQLGGDNMYVALCRKHFKEGILTNPEV